MPASDPRGGDNRALLVGVPEYAYVAGEFVGGVPGDLPAVRTGLVELEATLRAGGVFTDADPGAGAGGGAGGGVLRMEPSGQDDFNEVLWQIVAETRGVLLFYFAGHGAVPFTGEELWLQLPQARTVPGAQQVFAGSVSVTDLLGVLASSPARRIVVVLDCCFAGNAARILEGFEERHRFFLVAAVQANRRIDAGPPETPTPFTAALLDVLRGATPEHPVTFAGLGSALRERMAGQRTLSGEPWIPQTRQGDPDADVVLARAPGTGQPTPDRAALTLGGTWSAPGGTWSGAGGAWSAPGGTWSGASGETSAPGGAEPGRERPAVDGCAVDGSDGGASGAGRADGGGSPPVPEGGRPVPYAPAPEASGAPEAPGASEAPVRGAGAPAPRPERGAAGPAPGGPRPVSGGAAPPPPVPFASGPAAGPARPRPPGVRAPARPPTPSEPHPTEPQRAPAPERDRVPEPEPAPGRERASEPERVPEREPAPALEPAPEREGESESGLGPWFGPGRSWLAEAEAPWPWADGPDTEPDAEQADPSDPRDGQLPRTGAEGADGAGPPPTTADARGAGVPGAGAPGRVTPGADTAGEGPPGGADAADDSATPSRAARRAARRATRPGVGDAGGARRVRASPAGSVAPARSVKPSASSEVPAHVRVPVSSASVESSGASGGVGPGESAPAGGPTEGAGVEKSSDQPAAGRPGRAAEGGPARADAVLPPLGHPPQRAQPGAAAPR
ncbi:hypothetical protein ACFVBJ_29805, partial [Streptomyces sp. NPDC057676]